MNVVEQEYIPNRENPQKIAITVEADVNGERKQQRKVFSPHQVSNGTWEKHFVKWIENQEKETEIPDLQGETIENTGYDHTGPERDYPE